MALLTEGVKDFAMTVHVGEGGQKININLLRHVRMTRKLLYLVEATHCVGKLLDHPEQFSSVGVHVGVAIGVGIVVVVIVIIVIVVVGHDVGDNVENGVDQEE